MSPVLSVIIPVYRPARHHLIEALESLLPDADDLEVIVVNDCYSDVYVPTLIKKFASAFPSIHYLTNSSVPGLFGAYSSGYLCATAPFCTALDHDDRACLGPVLRYLRNNTAVDIVYTNECKFEESGLIKDTVWKPDFDPLSPIFYHYLHHFTVLETRRVRAAVTAASMQYQISSGFDLWLLARYLGTFAEQAPIVHHLKEFCYYWRIHPKSTAMSIGVKPDHWRDRISVASEFFEAMGDPGVFTVDSEHSYIVRARFTSYLQVQRALRNGLSASLIDGQSQDWHISVEGRPEAGPDWWPVLEAIPLNYLMARSSELVIPMPGDHSSWQYAQTWHPSGVPFLVPLTNPLPPLSDPVLRLQREGDPARMAANVVLFGEN